MAESNPPAFPSFETREQLHDEGYRTVLDSHGGMTLRDYFAAAAMASIVRDRDHIHRLASGLSVSVGEAVARIAYGIADYMLVERAKRDR
jgi:hypothetical protein